MISMDQELKVFAVVRCGNETDGPEGPDTVYYVVASSLEKAVSSAEERLAMSATSNIQPYAEGVIMLGRALRGGDGEILMGPLYGIAYHSGSSRS